MRMLNLFVSLLLAAGLLLAVFAGDFPAAATLTTRHVAPNGDCAGATPCYATLQTAIDAAAPGDEIRVAQGVYTDVTAFEYHLSGWTQVITQAMFISKPLTVRGGYAITDWTVSQPMSYPTVINPQGQGRGGVIAAPSGTPSIAVTVEGLVITNGYAEGSGGGLYADGGTVTISGCHIHHNHGGSLAGGLYLNSHSVTLTQNRIEHNTGEGYGVAVEMGLPVRLFDNYILSNTNGLLLWSNVAALTNTVIAGNADTGLTLIGGDVRAWHTTFADNGSVGLWAQHSGQGPATVALTNTILAGPGVGVQVVGHPESPSMARLAATLWHNLTDTQITGGVVTRIRDFTGDPAFVGAGDYRLTAASLARNRGFSSGVTRDIIGVLRDPLPDLGAYEYDDPDAIRQIYLPLVMHNQLFPSQR